MHRITWDTSRGLPASLTRLSRSVATFSIVLSSLSISHIKVPQPRPDKSGWFRLFRFRSPLLTESLSISFPPVTEMFHFTGCRDVPAMYSQKLEQVLPCSGYPIRKSTGQSVFAAHRSLTQLTTSFIAYWHQGIHDALFVA